MKKLIGALLAGFAICAQAAAAPVSYVFEASFSEAAVDGIDADDLPASSLFDKARVLPSISGVLTYNSNAQPIPRPVVTEGRARFDTPVSFTLDQLDLTFANDPGFASVSDADKSFLIRSDSVVFAAGSLDNPTAPGVFFDDSVRLNLVDSTNTAISDLILPDELILADFDSSFLAIGIIAYNVGDDLRREIPAIGTATAFFQLDRLERIAEVPVPAAFPLFLAGAAAVGAFLRRKK